MIRRLLLCFVLAAGAAAQAAAQTPLTLPEAIARARARNPATRAAAVAERESAQRKIQARAGYLPRVDVSESWQRGNQPVFVFSSLLSQRQFTAADFALATLNHPDARNHFRSAITVEQTLFDGAIRANIAAGDISHDIAGARRTSIDHDLAVGVTDAYASLLSAEAGVRSAAAAVDRARADRDLAANRRDAGVATDADVLQLEVFLSRALEQQIRAVSDERVARAALNQLMGDPLETPIVLEPPAAAPSIDVANVAALEAEAIRNRPDVALAALQERLAASNHSAARAALLPQASLQGGWEFNGGTWDSRASSWLIGAAVRVNVFRGFADRARIAEAREEAVRRSIEREQTEAAVRFDVYTAVARLEAARASAAAGRAAVEQARESQRITRDRYEAGLTDVASLLRSAEAIAQAEAQHTTAELAVLTGTAAIERTLGRR